MVEFQEHLFESARPLKVLSLPFLTSLSLSLNLGIWCLARGHSGSALKVAWHNPLLPSQVLSSPGQPEVCQLLPRLLPQPGQLLANPNKRPSGGGTCLMAAMCFVLLCVRKMSSGLVCVGFQKPCASGERHRVFLKSDFLCPDAPTHAAGPDRAR